MLLGLLGVTLFGLTLPATRLALESFHPVFIATGRALLATALAAIYLSAGKHRLPTLAEVKYLFLVVLGVAIGFPVFTALAMQQVDASHGGVMLGIMPLTTAACAAWLFKERPSIGFWLMALLGSSLVVAFSLTRGQGSLNWADVWLLLAVLTGSLSYATGGHLAKSLGGLQVISWTLVLATPFLLGPALWFAPRTLEATHAAWFGFLYVAFISQYLAFLPWFKGLSLGGIARVGQAQLLQPFVTLIASTWLLNEHIDWQTWAFAIAVCIVVATGRTLSVRR